MNKFYRFVMLMALFLAVGVTSKINAAVYLQPGPCNNGDEEWWAYTWTDDVTVTDENGNETTTPGSKFWTQGTSISDGKYSFDLDGKGYKVIFVRMNPNRNGNDASWNYVWNQTNDLTIFNEATYNITGFVENSNLMSGNWIMPETPATGKTVWQQTDPNGANYIGHRRALTGRHCMVNKLVSVVEVGNWVRDLDNMVDEDINNMAVFPSVASVGVGAKPITSIRDVENHYAAGTTAGFSLVASTGASVLNLAVANAWTINFYLEGKLMGTKAVTTGQNAGGVGLTLIKLPGSDEVTLDLSATAPCEFDEISLMPTGLADASVITNTRIKYAFVGDDKVNTITQTSMQNYAAEHGRTVFSLDQGKKQIYSSERDEFNTDGIELGHWVGSNLINDDLTDGVVWGVISIGASLDCRVGAAIHPNDPDKSMPFKKGSTVGFKVSTGSLLKLPVGTWAKIRLFKGEWQQKTNIADLKLYDYEYVQTEVQEETINANVLALSLVSGGEQFPTITAKEDFSHMEITFYTVLSVDLGGMKGWYGFVSDPADVSHKCDLGLSANASICSKDTEYQLTAAMPVTWEITEQPGSASIDESGKLTGISPEIDGNYVIKATAADGCFDYITITHGLGLSSQSCDNPIVSVGEEPSYVLTESVNDGGALININGNLQDPENVLNQSLEDYAIFSSALNATVVENLPIVGVKKTNGLISDGSNAHRIGFIVEAQSTGLTADVIDLFNIRTYNNGVQTESKVIKETNSVKVKLIGSNKTQKLRFAVDIPAGVQFDEFVLWKSGVLDLSIDRFKIYYAFDEAIVDEDEPTECFDPLGCASTVISNTTNARIDGNNVQFAGGVNAANVVDNLTFLVDDDINTGISLSNTVSLGDGLVLAVDLGRVYPKTQQVGLIMDSKTYLAGVTAGSWITIKTYLNGVEKDSHSDWSVLGVNAIGYGDKSYIFINPTSDYDEVRVTIANIANLLEFDSKYYGIFVRNDYDQDGTPDCKDDDSCSEEYTLDEQATTLAKPQDYPDGNLVLHRSFELGEWNCITLPVDLSWKQVRNAFGNQVQIAKPVAFYFTSWIHNDNPNGSNYKLTMLYYTPCKEEDGEIAIEKNQYYIIKPFREADLTAGTYTAKDGNTVNFPVYFIPKVTYKREYELAGGVVPSMTLTYRHVDPTTNPSSKDGETNPEENSNIILHGSQVYLDGKTNGNVAQNDYVYVIDPNKEEGKRSSLERVTSDAGAPMLGFRFYAENNTPYEIQNDEGYDVPTSIMEIFNDIVKPSGVYTIDGRQIRTTNSTFGLPAGIYIVGGKKVIITQK